MILIIFRYNDKILIAQGIWLNAESRWETVTGSVFMVTRDLENLDFMYFPFQDHWVKDEEVYRANINISKGYSIDRVVTPDERFSILWFTSVIVRRACREYLKLETV